MNQDGTKKMIVDKIRERQLRRCFVKTAIEAKICPDCGEDLFVVDQWVFKTYYVCEKCHFDSRKEK